MVFVLDLDGVILRTNLLKHDAMLSLVSQECTDHQAVSQYILDSGGIRRDEKLAHILEVFLHHEVTPSLLSTYLQRYADQLEFLLAEAPMIEGVEKFLSDTQSLCYVCSSAPEHEVESQLVRRNLRRHFSAVYSSQTPKAEALLEIQRLHPCVPIVFFGDALEDRAAAASANVAFVGITGERSFAGSTQSPSVTSDRPRNVRALLPQHLPPQSLLSRSFDNQNSLL